VLPLGIAALLVLLVVLSLRSEESPGPPILFFGVVGLLIWRRMRNRGRRMMARFTAKLRKMPEVRVVAVDGQRATIVVDRALAKTYVRINALMDGVNRKLFFGEPYTAVIRDDLAADEVRGLLRGPGVLYVRDDVVEGGG
jgi:xanthosine utilization system XapX-like protein